MNETSSLDYRLIETANEQLELFPVDAARLAELSKNHDLVLSARGPYYRKADDESAAS